VGVPIQVQDPVLQLEDPLIRMEDGRQALYDATRYRLMEAAVLEQHVVCFPLLMDVAVLESTNRAVEQLLARSLFLKLSQLQRRA
jgi:hypothetical protein